MKTPFFAALAILPLAALAPSPAADDAKPKAGADGWRTLFDGKNTDGWEHVGPGKMVIEGGVMRTEGGMGLLWYTREKFGDCTIRVVYKTATDHSNSGVFIRIADKPKDAWYGVHHGFEVQIDDAGDEFHRTGAVYSMAKATAKPGKVGRATASYLTC
ncbi:MAG TPA: DUF1080 domain-containing protein [Isosphaeraceae bacterium]|jgi:hypothetical protein|nr:DUF1080 domain-containing protein [Isosphaeraceae bacterium]